MPSDPDKAAKKAAKKRALEEAEQQAPKVKRISPRLKATDAATAAVPSIELEAPKKKKSAEEKAAKSKLVGTAGCKEASRGRAGGCKEAGREGGCPSQGIAEPNGALPQRGSRPAARQGYC